MSEVVKVKKRKRWPFLIGLLVLSLAITGVVSIVDFALDEFSAKEEEVDYTEYADFLTWVVGVDPDPISDITKADKSTLLNIALCTLLTDGVKTGEYNVTEKGLIVPAADVEAYHLKMFGADVSMIHASVIGYGYEFIYDAKTKTYTVPLTGVTPPFTARIESVEKTGGLVVLRVGYVGTNSVEVSPDGTLSATQPDKYADITLKETETGYNLISLITVTKGEYQ
ncbi:MAG: hypothetical protein E7533_05440 [Ruminococcaceae bacterium]|nr:hypothetical protein [Oscillospiraceae bacterium]